MFGSVLTAALRDREWDAKLVCLSQGNGPRVAAMPVSSDVVQPLNRLSLKKARALARVMRHHDVVLANGSSSLVYTLLGALLTVRRPAIAYASIGEPAYWAKTWFRRRVQRLLLGRFDAVAAVSKETERQLVEIIGLRHDRVIYAPTGVQLGGSSGRAAPKGPLHIAFIGSLNPEKRPGMFVDLLDQLSRTEWSARIVGDGPLRAHLEGRVEAAGLADRLSIDGALQDISGVLQWADVLVQTSESEGLPGVVMEAAAAGVPSMAFDVGGTRELVEHGISGWLMPEGDFERMAELLDGLVSDRTSIQRFGESARLHVAAHFELAASVDRYVHVLNRAIEQHRQGR